MTAAVRSSAKERLLEVGVLDTARLADLRAGGRPIRSERGGSVSAHLGPGDDDRVIIRHYRRAGPLGRFLGDRYFLGERPLHELAAYEAARSAGVPVPEPLAAILRRSGLCYRADLIVREVTGAVTLQEYLRSNPSHEAVRAAAAALADAFAHLVDAGIYHPDFHAGNVLVREDGADVHISIIDFDRAKQFDSLPAARRDEMLFRFNRALVKRSISPGAVGLRTRMRFCRQAGAAGSPDEARRFAARCAAHLRRHVWHY